MVLEHSSNNNIIVIDPSYIKKSGKHTSGRNHYWPGVAGEVKWGLEIAGIASIDLDNHTAFHLEAVQTLADLKQTSLLDYYGDIVIQRKEQLQEISKHIVADAFFLKITFIEKLTDNNFEVTSRLRNDAALQYWFNGEQKKGRERPKKFDGKVDCRGERCAMCKLEVKTMCHNELLLKRFFNVFGIPPNKQKNNHKIRELISYRTIAA